MTDCDRCRGTGGILIDEGMPGDPSPGPCPDCGGTGINGAICDQGAVHWEEEDGDDA